MDSKHHPLHIFGAIAATLLVLLVSITSGAIIYGHGAHANNECQGNFVIDFAGFAPGTVMTEQYASRGVHIAGVGNQGFPDAVVLYDSDATPPPDQGLFVHLGNIAVLPQNLTDENHDGLVDHPRESNYGGKQIYTFDQPVHIGSFLMIDKNHGTPDHAFAYDAGGNLITTALIPVSTAGSVQKIEVDADNVSKLVIDYRESAALTRIEVNCVPGPSGSPSATPTATPTPSGPAFTPTPMPTATPSGETATPTATGTPSEETGTPTAPAGTPTATAAAGTPTPTSADATPTATALAGAPSATPTARAASPTPTAPGGTPTPAATASPAKTASSPAVLAAALPPTPAVLAAAFPPTGGASTATGTSLLGLLLLGVGSMMFVGGSAVVLATQTRRDE